MASLKIAVITPVKDIKNVMERLKKVGDLEYFPDPKPNDMHKLKNANILFTNPNKTKVFLGSKELKDFNNLIAIVTASTGTVHIDKDYCAQKKIKVINISKEYEFLRRISSTAELALTGTLAACRNYIQCVNDARDISVWDYERYVGRQILGRNIGVVGYGRLGSMYANYMLALGANVFVFETNKSVEINNNFRKAKSLQEIFLECEIVSLHIHADDNNINLINESILQTAKPDLILVNTSRGEIVNERDIVQFLKKNINAIYVTDVIANEASARKKSPLYSKNIPENQLIISQHIGGMTRDAQEIAYNRAIDLLEVYLEQSDFSN